MEKIQFIVEIYKTEKFLGTPWIYSGKVYDKNRKFYGLGHNYHDSPEGALNETIANVIKLIVKDIEFSFERKDKF